MDGESMRKEDAGTLERARDENIPMIRESFHEWKWNDDRKWRIGGYSRGTYEE